MQTTQVLIVDEESSQRTLLFRTFEKLGCQAITASQLEEAKAWIRTDKKFHLVVAPQQWVQADQQSFKKILMAQNPHVQIVQTLKNNESPTIEAEGSLMAQKPFDTKDLYTFFKNLLPNSSNNSQKPTHTRSIINLIGQSSSIQQVLRLIDKVADSDSTILIRGESGTGKELIARAIHHQSSRRSGPFIAINCGAIPSELLESELFGHIKGAFTGAVSNRAGRFELADGGTLFLDEIGDLKPSLQVKILRALQERSFEPVGGTKTLQVDVRVIAATHVDLEDAVEKGLFREDLYYRLNVIPLLVPALRERKEDIPILLQHFIQHFNKTKNKTTLGIDDTALACLVDYAWPGNIRELENLIERLTILKGEGWISIEDLPIKYKQHHAPDAIITPADLPDDGLDFNSAVDAYENALILKALERTGWNRNQAAALLRLNRTTLVEKIKKKGLTPPIGDKDI